MESDAPEDPILAVLRANRETALINLDAARCREESLVRIAGWEQLVADYDMLIAKREALTADRDQPASDSPPSSDDARAVRE